jgi:hypothetical protein
MSKAPKSKTEAEKSVGVEVEQAFEVVSAPRVSEDEGARRIAEIRSRRQERGHVDVSELNQKLTVADDRKDPRFTYRWALDVGNRIHDLKAKDWDIAPGSTTAGDARDVGVGTVPERMGNTRTVPKPERHVLMRKPKEFYEEDSSRKAAKIKKDEESIMRTGDVRSPEGLSGPGSYIPAGGMKIEHGR